MYDTAASCSSGMLQLALNNDDNIIIIMVTPIASDRRRLRTSSPHTVRIMQEKGCEPPDTTQKSGYACVIEVSTGRVYQLYI